MTNFMARKILNPLRVKVKKKGKSMSLYASALEIVIVD